MASSAAAGLTVLVIEEQRAVRKIIEQIMNTIGIDFVEMAEDAKEAIDWLNEGGVKFDLIVVSHHMEKMGGMEFCKTIRAAKDKFYHDTPVILASAEKTDDLLEEAKTIAVNNVLQKPFSPLDMKKEIEKIVGFAL